MAVSKSKPRKRDGKVRYRAEARVNGQRVRGSWRKNKAHAKQDETKIKHELFEGSYIQETRETLDYWFLVYIQQVAPNRLRESQIYARRSLYNAQLKGRFGRRRLTSITSQEIQRFYIKKKGVISTSYIHQIHKLLKQIFDLCVKWGALKTSPLSFVILPKLEHKPIEVWNVHECKAFLKAVEGKYGYIAFWLAIHTGMRLGERLALHWDEVDFKRNEIHVRSTLDLKTKERKEPKTKASKRIIPLEKGQMKVLKQFKINQEPLSRIVCASTEDGYATHTHIRTIMYETIKEIGIKKIRFHDLRHTHATLLIENKANIKAVQERLGHANIKITLDTYTHVTNVGAKEVAELASSIFEG